MQKVIDKIKKDHPDLNFSPGRQHCWLPESSCILYDDTKKAHFMEGLLHELGHARLGHKNFASDMDLLRKEVDAWQEASALAGLYGIDVDKEHIQDCLDSYRDWLFRRSRCPVCNSTGAQQNPNRYLCVNCGNDWRVSNSRLRRPYRLNAKK